MTPNNSELTSLMNNAKVRADIVLHLGTALVGDFYDWAGSVKDIISTDIDTFADMLGVSDDVHEFGDSVRVKGLTGFLVRFSTPSPLYPHPRTSWGVTRYRWFYSQTYEEACKLAFDWAAELDIEHGHVPHTWNAPPSDDDRLIIEQANRIEVLQAQVSTLQHTITAAALLMAHIPTLTQEHRQLESMLNTLKNSFGEAHEHRPCS